MNDPLLRTLATMNALGRNADSSTPLGRRNVCAKILVTAVFLLTMLSMPLARLSGLLLFAIYPIVAAACGGAGYAPLFRRSLVVLPLVVFIGLFNLLYDREPLFSAGGATVTRGCVTFLSIAVRGLLSVQALLLLVASTGYVRLCRGLGRLGLPSVFVVQLLLVYRYLQVIAEEALSMRRARDARSFGRRSYPLRVWGRMIGQLLLRTFERSVRIGRAMSARGFTGRMPDAPGPAAPWTRGDTLFLAGWSAALLLLRLLQPAERLGSLFRTMP